MSLFNEYCNYIIESHEYPEAKGREVGAYQGDIGWKGKVIRMSPDRFLELATRIQDFSVKHKSISNIAKRIHAKLPIDPLVLIVDMKTKKVVGHEGRHRAMTSRSMGIKEVPVLILTGSDFKRVPNWTPEDHAEVEKSDFAPQSN